MTTCLCHLCRARFAWNWPYGFILYQHQSGNYNEQAHDLEVSPAVKSEYVKVISPFNTPISQICG
jgi:hypothetical protein